MTFHSCAMGMHMMLETGCGGFVTFFFAENTAEKEEQQWRKAKPKISSHVGRN